MTNDEILEVARSELMDFAGMGNVTLTGATPKMPRDAQDLLGVAFTTPNWSRAIGLGRRGNLTRSGVAHSLRELARMVDKRFERGNRPARPRADA